MYLLIYLKEGCGRYSNNRENTTVSKCSLGSDTTESSCITHLSSMLTLRKSHLKVIMKNVNAST